MQYASTAQLAAYMDPDSESPTAPANATVLIRAASALIDKAIESAFYAVDSDDLPTDPKVAAALADATCEQAQAWALNGIDPRKSAAVLAQSGRVVASKSLDGISVSYEQNAAATAALTALQSGDYLIPAAMQILRSAGLITSKIVTTDQAAADTTIIDARPYDPGSGRFIDA